MIRIISFWLSLLCCAATASAQELKKIKIGYPAIAYNQIQIWVAKDAGLFRKHGLDAEIVYFRGGQMATQALVAGDPPIVNIGTVVQANLQGHDVVLIASSENTYSYSVVARPGITTIEQLRGKRLGVSGFGSASHNASVILFKRFNLEPNKDVAVVVAGPTSDRLSAVESGRVDATVVTPPELPRARKQGLVEVYDMLALAAQHSKVNQNEIILIIFERVSLFYRQHVIDGKMNQQSSRLWRWMQVRCRPLCQV